MALETAPLTLGTEDIRKLLLRYSIPAIIAMTASSLYNMMDSIFIGHGVGPYAISGLGITLPFMTIAAAFGSLVGAGASTLVSVKLGQKDTQAASNILGHVLILNLIIGSVFTILSLLFLDKILILFGASPLTLPYAHDYMFVILCGNLITHIYMGLNEVMRASGYPQRAMMATLFAVFLNGVLNYIFIFICDLGIRGAALGTIVAQFISLLGVIAHFSSRKSFIHFQKGILKFKRNIAKNMLAIGLAPFLMNLCACLVVIIINNGLKEHGGDLAVGAYSIINRIVLLFVMIVMGFNQGMQPIAGYNYGAQQMDRVIKVLKYTLYCGVSVATIGFLICELFPHQIIYLFTTDETLINTATHGIRIVLACFAPVGIQLVASGFFQSIGMPKKAIFLSLTRQLLFLIPFLLILPCFFGINGVWMSIPIADAISVITAVTMLIYQIRKFKKDYELA
ncbi:MAG: MATE family efflux transporter [Odoribacter sp.]|nr:MATE family efflux transporter [Odoribacter sp.]